MRRNYVNFIIYGLLVILIIAFIYNFYVESNEIPAEIARHNLIQGKYDYVVDVRTEEEWNEAHLPYAISIPIGNLVSELPKKIPNKNASILFVCKKGIRASGVVTIAHKLGYKNVQAMIGNYKELENSIIQEFEIY